MSSSTPCHMPGIILGPLDVGEPHHVLVDTGNWDQVQQDRNLDSPLKMFFQSVLFVLPLLASASPTKRLTGVQISHNNDSNQVCLSSRTAVKVALTPRTLTSRRLTPTMISKCLGVTA
jgi:hypothetical protein